MRKLSLLITSILLTGYMQQAGAQCSVATQPTNNCTYGDMIDAFSLNGISSTSSGAGCVSSPAAYASFNSPVWSLTIGSTYPWTANVGGGSYSQGVAIWIDLNNNGQYETTEMLASSPYAKVHSSTITIPVTATPGQVPMRVRCAYNHNITASEACTNSIGSYGETEDYKVNLISPCTAPANVAATNIDVTAATLSWNAVSGSLGYEYKIDQSAGSPSGAGQFTSSTVVNATGLQLNTVYYFHVRNICSGSYSQWINYMFKTNDAYCKPPVQILYSSISSTSADFLWSMMPHADYYQYKVDRTPNAPNNGQNLLSTYGMSATVTGLQPSTWYYVYVRSICLNGADSSWWAVDSFFTRFGCDAPVTAIIGTDAAREAMWDPIPNAIGYEYVVNNSAMPPAFGAPLATNSVSITVPDDGKDYYFHVRAKCNSQFTMSAWDTKVLKLVTSIHDIDVNAGMSVYPNPVKDNLFVEWSRPVAGDAVLLLTDMSGRVIQRENVIASKMELNMAALTPGIYLLKYAGAGTSQVVRINKQ